MFELGPPFPPIDRGRGRASELGGGVPCGPSVGEEEGDDDRGDDVEVPPRTAATPRMTGEGEDVALGGGNGRAMISSAVIMPCSSSSSPSSSAVAVAVAEASISSSSCRQSPDRELECCCGGSGGGGREGG